MFRVTFSDFVLTDYFNVESVERSILPPREVNLLNIPSRHGAYFTNATYGARTITLNINLIGDSPTGFIQLMKAIAYCLDVEAPSELILSDDPSVKYYAIFSENSDIDEIFNIGKGSLTFICPDPFGYAIDDKVITPSNGYFAFHNDGTTTSFPRFTVNFQNEATFVSLTSPDGVILVGNPSQAGQIILPKTELALSDSMDSLNGWTVTGTTTDSDSTVTTDGTIGVVDGGLTATSFGTGNGWHGSAVRKNLTTPVEDFTVQARLLFKSQAQSSDLDGDQLGRIDIYLYDANGVKIGKMSMSDRHEAYEYNIPEIYAGNSTFLESEPKPPSPQQITQRVQDSKGTWANITKTITPTDVGDYNDFDGILSLSRVNNRWEAQIARIDSRGRRFKPLTRFYYDTNTLYPTGNLAYIVIHFTRYEDYIPCEVMRVTDLRVVKHNPDTVYDVEALFRAGDTLEIDTNDSSVWLNGVPYMQYVDVGSTFFPIISGTTEVKINSNDALATYTATFNERFL